MELFIILIVVIIGLTLLVLEFLVLPGAGIAGILGFGCVCFGIYLGYNYYGTPTGHYILGGIILLSLGITVYAVRSRTWRKLSLKASVDSTVEGVGLAISPGDTGRTIGRLAPMGKVKVGNEVVEAMSISGYIDNNQEVEVVKVNRDKIMVKLMSE